jgi:ABC-type lipoprotein export system ATPase subunit
MENDILTTIIAVECEIQERLAAEEQRAAEMLDNLRRELEEEATQEEERLAASVQQAVAAARAEAQGRADALVRRSTIRAERTGGLDDETLERCIMKHLSRITWEQNQ